MTSRFVLMRLRVANRCARLLPIVGFAVVSACTLLKKSDAELYGDSSGDSVANAGAAGDGGESGAAGRASQSGSAGTGVSPAGGGSNGGASFGGSSAGGTDATGGTGGSGGTGGATTTPPCPKFGNFPVEQDPEWGHCFVGVTDKLYSGLAESTSACQRLGAGFQLASIRSDTEAAAAKSVRSRLPEDKYLMVGYVQASGATAPNAGWHWLDGSPDGFGSFIGWDSGEPNDVDDVEDGTEGCASYIPAGLVDTSCAANFPLCEGPP